MIIRISIIKLLKIYEVIKIVIKKIISLQTLKNTWNALTGDYIIAYWWKGNGNKNWGDKINPWLIRKLSGKKVLHTDDILTFPFFKVYVCAGSILHQIRFFRTHIWGSGIISKKTKIKFRMSRVYAVRGPLTAKKLNNNNIDCPNVYGDPALIFPHIYEPDVDKTYEVGLVPNYSDKNLKIVDHLEQKGVYIIDVFSGETEFVDAINRCKYILSSSLHGLIIADAYEIKSKWVKLSNNLYGDGIKFVDYYKSIRVENEKPIIIDNKVPVEELKRACWKKNTGNLSSELLESCPFYDH